MHLKYVGQDHPTGQSIRGTLTSLANVTDGQFPPPNWPKSKHTASCSSWHIRAVIEIQLQALTRLQRRCQHARASGCDMPQRTTRNLTYPVWG